MNNLIKKLVLAAVVGVATSGWASIDFTGSGGSYTATSTDSASIPDYPDTGVAYSLHFNDSYFNNIIAISVTFTTTGGWNGDIYAYLSHGDGIAYLLNRVGASSGDADGYNTSGFNNITLSSSGTTDIHGVPTPTTAHGAYEADGRVAYTDTARPDTLNVFGGANPNGDWTLYFGDEASGNTSTLTSWHVDLTAVPEPVNVALGVFGVVVVGTIVVRRYFTKSKVISI
jgi:hypothetical protein